MNIFLIRHFESTKNINYSFSSDVDNEELTVNGIIQGKKDSLFIKKFIEQNNYKVRNIYCADSVRARKTAEIISAVLSDGIKIQTFSDLNSYKSRETVGKTYKELSWLNPQLAKQLSLYESGIFNAYKFNRENPENNKLVYEKKVINCIKKIINNNLDEDIKIIILHNSSITAAIIHYARQICDYPKDFYGKITANNGSLFWIKDEKEFIAANINFKTLFEVYGGEPNVT